MATRYAVVRRSTNGYPTPEQVACYLPSNYEVTGSSEFEVSVMGEDKAGWTLEGYVIPRLASGLIFAKESE